MKAKKEKSGVYKKTYEGDLEGYEDWAPNYEDGPIENESDMFQYGYTRDPKDVKIPPSKRGYLSEKTQEKPGSLGEQRES